MSSARWRRPRLRQTQVSGPGSVNIQAGGDVKGAPAEPWWCDCDEAGGPHVHCDWGNRGPHLHSVELSWDHRSHWSRGL